MSHEERLGDVPLSQGIWLALFRYPILPEDRLVGSLRNPPYDIHARLGQHDKLTNPAEVWSALDNDIRPSVSYVVTLALDPDQEIAAPTVCTATVRLGQSETLPHEQTLIKGAREWSFGATEETVIER